MSLTACALAMLLNLPGSASATPALNFNSDVTKVSFDSLDIIYGWEKEDFFHHSHRDDSPKIRLIVREPADYYVVTNTVLSGGYSGWHTHPGPSVVLVKSGSATVYDGDDPNCTPLVYPAGTGFVDPGDGHVHMVRNEGSDTLVTQAFQIIPEGESRRIDAPSPGNCPF
jgi:quercetin dioxygenase-like cupin family protein